MTIPYIQHNYFRRSRCRNDHIKFCYHRCQSHVQFFVWKMKNAKVNSRNVSSLSLCFLIVIPDASSKGNFHEFSNIFLHYHKITSSRFGPFHCTKNGIKGLTRKWKKFIKEAEENIERWSQFQQCLKSGPVFWIVLPNTNSTGNFHKYLKIFINCQKITSSRYGPLHCTKNEINPDNRKTIHTHRYLPA